MINDRHYMLIFSLILRLAVSFNLMQNVQPMILFDEAIVAARCHIYTCIHNTIEEDSWNDVCSLTVAMVRSVVHAILAVEVSEFHRCHNYEGSRNVCRRSGYSFSS